MKKKKLSKMICRKCIDKEFPHAKWNKIDEESWTDHKLVYCYYGSKNDTFSCGIYTRIDSNPPEACPFILEHLVKQDDVK